MSNPVPASLALGSISGQISASPLNSDYSAIQTAVNALIALAGGGAVNQLLQAVDASHVQWAYAGGVYRKTTSKTVTNTVAETDLLNGEVTIGAGVLGTTGMMRLRLFLDILNNSGGAATWRFKVKLGGTAVFDSGAVSVPNQGASRTGMTLDFDLLNAGAANTNTCKVRCAVPAVSIAGSGGLGTGNPTDIGTGEKWTLIEASAPSAIDTASSKLLEVTVTHGTAAATIETKLYGAVVEVI